MKKFRDLKDYVKEHIPQVIAAVAGIIAVLLVGAIVIISISGGKEDESKVASTEKSASDEITLETTLKIEDNRETTTEQIEATTKGEKATTKKESEEEKTTKATNSKEPISQETTRKQEQASTSTQVTTTKAQTVVQPTTKKQEATTKKQETTAPVVRGKNGVILEELSLALYNMNTGVNEKIPVPKTYTEFKNSSSEEESGYVIVYNHPAVKQNDIFYNELEFRKSTKQDVINIYGKPLTTYSTVNGEFLVYQYGYYTNMEVDKIYIIFGFTKKLDMRFGGIQIGNVDIIN